MNSGWIKIHRKFLDWEWYDCPNTSRLFIHCLLLANHEDKKWRGEIIKRGSFITSINKLSEGSKLSFQNVRTSLKNLEDTGEVTRKSTHKLTKLTICEYDTYQNVEFSTNKLDNNQITNEQQTANNQITTTKEDKELKEYKNNTISSEPEKSAPSMIFDYTNGEFSQDIPEKWLQVWIEAYPAVNILSEISKAKAWLFANPKKRKKDYKRFLTNWISRVQERGGNIASNQPKQGYKL